MPTKNEFGQPVGDDLGSWSPPPRPSTTVLSSERVRLEPLDRSAHSAALFEAFAEASASLWTYMSFGPFETANEIGNAIDALRALPDWEPYAIVSDGKPLGFLSYLRIDQAIGVIEIGSIAFAPALQRTTAATEALYLMIKHAFDLGYRRCEWKCDDLNAPSRAAADRLGFRYEGTFRNATHYKGRSRDTAWYAITSEEWPGLQTSFVTWLSPDNFDEAGQQRESLACRSL